MPTHDHPSTPARADAAPTLHVGTAALLAARVEALRAFHKDLDEADDNLRALLPNRRPLASAEPSGPTPAGPAVPRFEMQAPWYVEPADQPA